MKKGDKILIEYRSDAFSSDLTRVTRSVRDLDEYGNIYVIVKGHCLKYTIDEVIEINGKPNPDYKEKVWNGDYCTI